MSRGVHLWTHFHQPPRTPQTSGLPCRLAACETRPYYGNLIQQPCSPPTDPRRDPPFFSPFVTTFGVGTLV